MSCFLTQPFIEASLWLAEGDGVFIYYYPRVVFARDFVDEKVVITAGNVIDGRKTFVAKENIFFVRKISSDSHVGIARQGK